MTYTVREELKPSGLNGISDEQINDHWGLYKGYVTQSNALKADLEKTRKDGETASMAYADRRRRFGFEFCGMVLHEYYFGNLKANVEQSTAAKFVAAKGIEILQAEIIETERNTPVRNVYTEAGFSKSNSDLIWKIETKNQIVPKWVEYVIEKDAP